MLSKRTAGNRSRWDVVVVAQLGQRLPSSVKYGTLQATLELAMHLRRVRRNVVLVGLSDREHGQIDNVPFRGAQNERDLRRLVRSLGPANTVIGISRADILMMTPAIRYVIYHHGPHPIQGGVPVGVLNKSRVPVICASQSSRAAQIAWGVEESLVHTIPNGYDAEVFGPSDDRQRSVHSLVYAGHVVYYKGVDIAVRAFAAIRRRLPDAVFRVYGRSCSWSASSGHLWAPDWLDSDGYPVWPRIEQDVPGLQYRGEVGQAELAQGFREHSLLVMPSRVGETFGIVSIEAQACGCIPVLPCKGAFPETLVDGKTGYLYDDNTPEGLAATVTELWRQGLPSEELRSAAQTWVRETFSWDQSGAAFLRIIESIPPRHGVEAMTYHLRWRWVRDMRALHRIGRSMKRVRRSLSGKALTHWPGLLRNLWLEYRQRRGRG